MMSYQNQESGSVAQPVDHIMTNVVETKMLYLSTKTSQCTLLNGDMKSLVQFDLKSYLDFQNDTSIQSVMMSMPYAILVNSNYQLNANNCRLDITLNGNNFSYTFPYGNYSAETFMQAFMTVMPTSFNISLNEVSGKFTVSNSASPFQFLGTSTCDYIIGFSGTVSSTEGAAPYSITMNRLCNFLPNPLFRVCVLNNTLYCGQVLGSAGNPAYSNVLASIPNTTKQNTQIVWQSFSDEFLIQNSNQTLLTLAIVDDNGNLVDFNGIASYFQVRIRIYRKMRRTNQSFSDFAVNATNRAFAIEEMGGALYSKPIHEIL